MLTFYLFVLFPIGYVTTKSYLPVTHLQFHRSASRSYFIVGPLECFGAPSLNKSRVSRERQRKAARVMYSLCHILNLSSPKPHTTVATSNSNQMRTGPTTRGSTDFSPLSTTGQQTNEILTHKSTVISSGSPSNNASKVVGKVVAAIIVAAMFLFTLMVAGYVCRPSLPCLSFPNN